MSRSKRTKSNTKNVKRAYREVHSLSSIKAPNCLIISSLIKTIFSKTQNWSLDSHPILNSTVFLHLQIFFFGGGGALARDGVTSVYTNINLIYFPFPFPRSSASGNKAHTLFLHLILFLFFFFLVEGVDLFVFKI